MTGPDGNPGHGPGALPALPPVGARRRHQREHLVLHARRLPAARPVTRSAERVADATAGVWEVTVEARQHVRRPVGTVHADRLALRRRVTPDPDVIPKAQVGVPVPRSYSLTNNFGSFIGRATVARISAAPGEACSRSRTTSCSTTRRRSRPARRPSARPSADPSDPAADLDLFVYRCGDASCTTRTLVGQSADGDSEESVTMTNPIAATYQVDRRRVRGPGGVDDVRLRRRLRQRDARIGRGHRCRR